MEVFLVKITNRENVDKILVSEEFTHKGIYNFESEIKENSPVFIVFSGDKAHIDWEQGVIGFGHVTKAPYEKGYDPSNKRYFKIDIQPDFILEHPLDPKFTKLHPIYQNELYDAPYVGAKHFPNQAIAKASGKSAEALYYLFKDIKPESVANLNYPFLKNLSMPSLELFRLYLESRIPKLKEKSISNYISGVKSTCSWIGFNIDELFSMSIDEVKQIYNIICNDQRDKTGKKMYSSAVQKVIEFLIEENGITQNNSIASLEKYTQLTKPFLLLAGISGTGKTRFVRAQAARSNGWYADDSQKPDNYELVAVRPDWHEPSDLLGYVSRIDGTKYVPTSFLRFLVKAWQDVFDNSGSLTGIGEGTRPFWFCLDEMNLAPVEQYFADYLSILESRKWTDAGYSSLPIISDNLEHVMEAFGGNAEDALWSAFLDNGGIPLPPNLIVAGTVNMDETTHGFSRKVIDRALTLDFQEFFPNRYNEFFTPQTEPKLFGFSMASQVSSPEDLSEATADPNGEKSINFLSEVNRTLKSTPFELAYRALNELLLSVKCFKPENKESLIAVWDDFLMQKVLPRIEGDAEKLCYTGEEESGLLNGLSKFIRNEFKTMLNTVDNSITRPDLLNQKVDGSDAEPCSCKSLDKIAWMQNRLEQNQYTSFWA